MSDTAEILWSEQFTNGIDLEGRWALLTAGDFIADDGRLSQREAGLRVVSAGSNPQSGDPAFTKDLGGLFGHLKWFASTRSVFDAESGPLRIAFKGAAARTFGAEAHPFGDAVASSGSDIRLGSLVLNVMDFASGMVFDFWMCSEAIYPYYERIPIPGSPDEVFGQVHDPIVRVPFAKHDLSLEIDAAAGTATWEVDGAVVATVAQIGRPNDDWTTVLHHGGDPADAELSSFVVSIGLMTLLDASLPPSQHGLVDLGVEYNHPRQFTGGPFLFGQGVEALIHRVEVTRP